MPNKYTGCNHILGNGIHIAMGNPSFIMIVDGKKYLTEWHHYCGPSVMNKDGSEARKQPAEGNPWWLAVQWWHDQGGVVVDGVGVWKVPEIETLEATAKDGSVVRIDYWKGYWNHGPITYKQYKAFIGEVSDGLELVKESHEKE